MNNCYYVTDICGKTYSKKDLSEIFGYGKAPLSKMFIISCQSCPVGYYPSWVSFTEGIDYQLIYFIRDNGISTVEINNMTFTIDIRDNHPDEKVDRKFETFSEALGYVMMEDERFWSDKTLVKNDSIYMRDKH